jgi:hypothetical protein
MTGVTEMVERVAREAGITVEQARVAIAAALVERS